MSKASKIIIAIVVIVAIVAIAVTIVFMNSKPKTNLEPINSEDDLIALMDKLYEGQENLIPTSLQTQKIDVTDNTMVKSFTGLENGEDLQYLIASEPMISSQAYSVVLAKVKQGANADKIAENIKEQVDYRKWICVSAEKVYTTSSGNVVCLVMSSEQIAKPIYEKFKTLAGNIGQEFEKTEEINLPPEMY